MARPRFRIFRRGSEQAADASSRARGTNAAAEVGGAAAEEAELAEAEAAEAAEDEIEDDDTDVELFDVEQVDDEQVEAPGDDEADAPEAEELEDEEAQAKRVIKFRDDRGFTSVEELDGVPGFPRAFLNDIKEQIVP